jgi:hypothetical protein
MLLWRHIRAALVLSPVVPALIASCTVFSCGEDPAPEAAANEPPPPADEAGSNIAPPSPGIDYLIVTADTLEASADHFKAYRETTGHKVAVRTVGSIVGDEKQAKGASIKLRDYVKSQYAVRDAAKPFFVLVLGDATEETTFTPSEVPTGHYEEEDDNSTTTTDNIYADVDGDHIPDLALGRIPVATDAEADQILARTKAYESTYEVGVWNRRLNLFASTSGFGEPADTTIETLVFKMVEELPYDFDLTLTYAKQTSPYVFVPERFSEKVFERLNEGSLMMAYVGHGDITGFATLYWNGTSFPIFDTSKLGASLNLTHKPPILTLIACLTGRFTDGESVSESMLKSKNGPVAVLSSTEISHPYPNALFIRELSQALTASPHIATVGELFVEAKRRSIKNGKDPLRQEIDAQVAPLGLTAFTRDVLKRTHLYMYTLFGDPAVRVAYTRKQADITLAAATVKPGADITVTGNVKGGLGKGDAVVSLESTRSTIAGTIKPVPADGDTTRDAIIAENYAAANERSVVKKTVPHENGKLTTTLTVPATLVDGTYYVKVYADDGHDDAIGSVKITVAK